MTFKEKYKIKSTVDFVDIELETDNELFVDPYLIYLDNSELAIQCANGIIDFFNRLLKYAILNDRGNGYNLVKNLQENNEIRLGYSKGVPRGTGVGVVKGKELFEEIRHSRAVKTGLVTDIFDTGIFIPKMGPDRISDFTVNIILEKLIDFTQIQCCKHKIPMKEVILKRPIWSITTHKWVKNKKVQLPVYDDKPIVLLPKQFVRSNLVYDYKRFYNCEMIPFYEKIALNNPSLGLVKILKRGIVPSRTKIKRRFPCSKTNVIKFIEKNPDLYLSYKNRELKYVKINSI